MARSTKAVAEKTRRRILDAAEGLFFSHGVAQTSLEQIAEAAGVSRGAIYWHFTDKVALFRALHEGVRLPQEDLVERAALGGDPDPLGLLETVACDSLKTLAGDGQLQRVYAILLFRCDYLSDMAEALARQNEADSAMHANLIRLFTMAERGGLLSSCWSPAAAERAFSAMMRGLWVDWLRYDRNFDLVGLGSECVRGMFCAFRAG